MKRAWTGLVVWVLLVVLYGLLPAQPASSVGASDASVASASAPAAGSRAPAAASAPAAPAAATPAPASAPAVLPSTMLPASSQACPPINPNTFPPLACVRPSEPLALEKTAVTSLPNAVVDQDYSYRFIATGGEPPYTFEEIREDPRRGLPAGLSLTADGTVTGTATQRGRKSFVVALHDQTGQGLRQTFSINVVAPRGLKPAGKAPDTPAGTSPATTIQTVSIAATQTPVRGPNLIDTWVLTQELLKQVNPVITEGDTTASDAPAGTTAEGGASAVDVPAAINAAPVVTEGDGLDELSAAGSAQLEILLKPLVGVEYPTRAMFAAALDAHVCTYAAALTDRVAQTNRQASPTAEQWRDRCAVAWQGPSPKAPVQLSEAPVKWQDLPSTLLPARVRNWLIEQARQSHDAAVSNAPGWQGTGCNCFTDAADGQVYGFVPHWSDAEKGPKLDFSLYDRLVNYAQPFDDDGNILQLQPGAAEIEFYRAVHRYGSKLDMTVYRRDWQFLQRLPEDQRRRIAGQVALHTAQMLNTRLSDFGARWQDRIPGLASDTYLGDGVTLFLDQLPSPADAGFATFASFRERLIRSIIAELHKQKRPITLNLMISAGDLVPALRDANGTGSSSAAVNPANRAGTKSKEPSAAVALPRPPGWTFGDLFDILVFAENPRFQDGRITAASGAYHSNTNVTVKYIVLLPEPTTRSKKVLREAVETTTDLVGTNRAIMVRRILPLISVGSAEPQQLADDLAYFNDNFGGVALWPQPLANPLLLAQTEKTVRSTILANEAPVSQLCNVVCDWRWALRGVFWLLILVAAVSLVPYLFSCRVRALGRPYQLYLLLAAIVPLVIGGLLLRCDPDLASSEIASRLLVGVLVVVILSMLYPLLKPRAERP
ncbi:Ig domain-containing protein [Cupriavidus sp. SW-Y-13]|uniref:Ig domain-containing protein n=1 Tax=Cupriavidus sp. SW-Y-13 TaxID=2653854 RepID=UPI0013664A57|nr:Ig domain-containing protein [Cupriavidus sp. SW-Y-13]